MYYFMVVGAIGSPDENRSFALCETEKQAEDVIKSGVFYDGYDGIGVIYAPLPEGCRIVPLNPPWKKPV